MFFRRKLQRMKRNNRRGGVYIAVLGVAMIVATIAMTSMQMARLEIRAGVASEEMVHAQLAAQSAVEFALARMEFYPDWRTRYFHGVEEPNGSWLILDSRAQYKFVLLDKDGDLADDEADGVTVRGVGVAGQSTSVATVSLVPDDAGLDSLAVSLHSQGNLLISMSASITTDQTVSSNLDIDGSGGAGVTGDAWAAGSIYGTVSGARDKFQSPPRAMPSDDTVFDYYLANGTVIEADSIAGLRIDKQLLSPSSNPFGTSTNPMGIYVIDCESDNIVILDSRIVGTLVLLDAGPESRIEGSIHGEPAVANYPVLMVQGDMKMEWDANTPLTESDNNMNFNPTGTPYLDVEDADQLDQYPGVINGLIYVSDDLTVTNPCNLNGTVVVGGVCNVAADLTLTYDSSFYNTPPPGFSAGPVMQIVPSTWQRVAY